MYNYNLSKYSVNEIDNNTAKTINGGGFFYWLGCQVAKIVNNGMDKESIKAVNSPITGPNGNKYM